MAFHKALLKKGAHAPNSEKHFHDYDQTWIVLAGRGTAYWIDHDGKREDFAMEPGDVLMIPAGYEHGSDGLPPTGKNSDDYQIAVFSGTMPVGGHAPGHYHMEKENYLPRLVVRKDPTDRYRK